VRGRALQLHFTIEDEGVFTMPWSAASAAPARWLGGEEEAFAPLGGEAARHLCLDAINVGLSKKLFMTEYAADLSPQPAF
jgi:hypothetical protein